MNTKIYCVFPACGKTWLCEQQKHFGVSIMDSDSSQFSWIYLNRDEQAQTNTAVRRIRNPEFPENYIAHIKSSIGKCDYIFVSTHLAVRKALESDGIDFTIVYPDHSCKAEWVGRCYIREQNGEKGCSAAAMLDNWDLWISECIGAGIDHEEIVLNSNEYLSDYFLR